MPPILASIGSLIGQKLIEKFLPTPSTNIIPNTAHTVKESFASLLKTSEDTAFQQHLHSASPSELQSLLQQKASSLLLHPTIQHTFGSTTSLNSLSLSQYNNQLILHDSSSGKSLPLPPSHDLFPLAHHIHLIQSSLQQKLPLSTLSHANSQIKLDK